jgi:hypothetical protein
MVQIPQQCGSAAAAIRTSQNQLGTQCACSQLTYYPTTQPPRDKHSIQPQTSRIRSHVLCVSAHTHLPGSAPRKMGVSADTECGMSGGNAAALFEQSILQNQTMLRLGMFGAKPPPLMRVPLRGKPPHTKTAAVHPVTDQTLPFKLHLTVQQHPAFPDPPPHHPAANSQAPSTP